VARAEELEVEQEVELEVEREVELEVAPEGEQVAGLEAWETGSAAGREA
jgi:hypothetical protein